MKKLRSILTSAVLVAALLIPAAQPASAVGTSLNLAGRPIGGDATTSCHGLAYGRVDGNLVLFTASHCRPAGGGAAYGPGGVRLGIWGSNVAAAYDLTYILLEGTTPSNPNQIYRGGSPASWWTMTVKYPSSTLSEANIDTRFGFSVYHNWQTTTSSTLSYRTGTLLSYANDPTEVLTSLLQHTSNPAYKDSGSGIVLAGYTNTIAGVGTRQQGGKLVFSPTYNGIYAIHNYFMATYGTSAFFCANSACT